MVYPYNGILLRKKLPLCAIHIDESQKNYAEQKPRNKISHTFILYDSIWLKLWKRQTSSIMTKSRSVVAWDQGIGWTDQSGAQEKRLRL